MLTIYVRHYLTPSGIRYFKTTWYPKVLSVITKQKGFVSLTYTPSQEVPDLIDLTLKFKDDATFDAWLKIPDHDVLINALDAHRSRDYFEVVKTKEVPPSKLDWVAYKVG
jgi:antibiotic biosynthesis monooxygenase (ABM) superfamily enzyme